MPAYLVVGRLIQHNRSPPEPYGSERPTGYFLILDNDVTPMDNQQIRQHMRHQRSQLSPEQQKQVADRILTTLQSLPEFQQARHIGLYFAVNGEVPTLDIWAYAQAHKKSCYLPKLNNDSLVYSEADIHGVLEPNKYGIPEPIAGGAIQADTLDCVLVPLVAFSPQGDRLGMGKAYYDKTFAFRQHKAVPPLIGLAYDWQAVEDFATQPWDIPMDIILTDKQIFRR